MCFSPFRGTAVCPGSRMLGFVADLHEWPNLDHFQNVPVARHSGQNRCCRLSAVQKPGPSLSCHPLPGGFSKVFAPSLSLLIDSPGKLDGRFLEAFCWLRDFSLASLVKQGLWRHLSLLVYNAYR